MCVCIYIYVYEHMCECMFATENHTYSIILYVPDNMVHVLSALAMLTLSAWVMYTCSADAHKVVPYVALKREKRGRVRDMSIYVNVPW